MLGCKIRREEERRELKKKRRVGEGRLREGGKERRRGGSRRWRREEKRGRREVPVEGGGRGGEAPVSSEESQWASALWFIKLIYLTYTD